MDLVWKYSYLHRSRNVPALKADLFKMPKYRAGCSDLKI